MHADKLEEIWRGDQAACDEIVADVERERVAWHARHLEADRAAAVKERERP